jgi:hypothetical protein
MQYKFGDIIDARKVSGLKHFLVVVGEITRIDKITGEDITEVMFYKVTSHVYAVFKTILAYFNYCLLKRDPIFLKFYSKEKDNTVIVPYGSLCQAVFLDRDTHYKSCLDVESMVIINSDPQLIDKKVIENLTKVGKIIPKNHKLTKFDAINLMNTIRYSRDVSPERQGKVSTCFNDIKSELV